MTNRDFELSYRRLIQEWDEHKPSENLCPYIENPKLALSRTLVRGAERVPRLGNCSRGATGRQYGTHAMVAPNTLTPGGQFRAD